LFLLHPVHGGGAVVHLSDLVVHARIEQDPLGRRRLPGIDVSHDADVARALERSGPGHDGFFVGFVRWPSGDLPDGDLPASYQR
jgi:hypothetical protein